MDDRRRAQRQSAVWMGSCQVEGEPPHLWLGCGVFDFSTLGVGMDFRHADALGLVGRRISVRLPVGDSIDMTLTGEVRNAKVGPGGIVVVRASNSSTFPRRSSTSWISWKSTR